MESHCLICNADIAEHKFDKTFLFLIPVIFPERKKQNFKKFQQKLIDRLAIEKTDFYPSFKWNSKLKEKLP